MTDSLVPVGIALLCIVALGLGAASLATDSTGSGSEISPGGSSIDTSQSGNGGATGPAGSTGQQAQSTQGDDECIAGYNQMEINWMVIVLIILFATLVVIYTGEFMLGVITVPVLLVASQIILIGVFSYLGCPPPLEDVNPATDGNVTGDGWEFSNEGEESSSLVDRLQFGGLIVGFTLAAFLLGFYAKYRNSDSVPDDETNEIGAAGVDTEIAAAAGDAADEIAGVDHKNGVYRAWARMTEALDVEHPETSTPGEFADAALAAGIDDHDVSELTRLFETVRYGAAPVTATHEKRAQEVLRRIERAHDDGDDIADSNERETRADESVPADDTWDDNSNPRRPEQGPDESAPADKSEGDGWF